MRLLSKAAIVFGGGVGVGRAAAIAFARAGADVVVGDIDVEGAQATARDVQRLGRRGFALKVDVLQRPQVDTAVRSALESFGKVDILVSVPGPVRPNQTPRRPEREWQEVIDVHLTGTFNCLQAVVPHFRERQYGKFITVTAPSGERGAGGLCLATARAGVVGLVQTAAQELTGWGVCINAICPEVEVMTPAGTPPGRWAESEDIAATLIFLASDDASSISGQALSVGGGRGLLTSPLVGKH